MAISRKEIEHIASLARLDSTGGIFDRLADDMQGIVAMVDKLAELDLGDITDVINTERKNASVVYDECGWSYHYPSDEYAFMHKFPTNVTPVYLMRLAEIRLLHAEALANTDDPGGAADIVDEIRGRAGIGKLTAAQRASADLMREAVLHERRLELAMEGFRWFDLMRYGDDYSKLFEICDGVNIKGSASYDSYFQTRRAMNDNRVLMPVPTSVLEDNTNIEQNLGY